MHERVFIFMYDTQNKMYSYANIFSRKRREENNVLKRLNEQAILLGTKKEELECVWAVLIKKMTTTPFSRNFNMKHILFILKNRVIRSHQESGREM